MWPHIVETFQAEPKSHWQWKVWKAVLSILSRRFSFTHDGRLSIEAHPVAYTTHAVLHVQLKYFIFSYYPYYILPIPILLCPVWVWFIHESVVEVEWCCCCGYCPFCGPMYKYLSSPYFLTFHNSSSDSGEPRGGKTFIRTAFFPIKFSWQFNSSFKY